MTAKTYLPKPPAKPVSFSVPVPEELTTRFAVVRGRTGLNRAEFIRALLVAGLDAIEAELEAASDSEAAG